MSPDYSPLHAGMSCGFLPAAKEMSRQVFVLQHESWMSSSKTGTQTSQHATGQHRATKGQLELWEWGGGSVRFNSTMLAVIQQTWAVPYCVRSPCSPLCKHPPCTPSRLYSDPEQEVISYPTSASAFLSQVVNVPGSRPPKPRDGGWWRAGRVQPWRAVGWTLDWDGTTRIRWYPSLMFYPPD